MRTLQKFISEQDNDVRFYIGTSAGTGFIFIGTKEDFEKEIDALSETRLTEMKKSLKDSIPELKMMVKKGAPGQDDDSPLSKDYCEKIASYGRTLANLAKRVVDLPKEIKEFVPYRDRKVRKTYQKDSIPEEIGTAIIIEGNDPGKYWLYSEYLNSKVSPVN